VATTLSKSSEYEQKFRTRHRTPGRPTDTEDVEPLFPAGDAHPVLANVARRRAYALVHEENKDRLREVFASELKVLRRRGLETVAEDARINLAKLESAEAVESSSRGA
jgi:hypothetical protein